jgi:1,4-dihydroxy-2-naphthoyl-CoA hydrolase
MRPPSSEQLQLTLKGFDRLYGLELLSWSDTEARARVAVSEQLKQPAGLVHGGVYASIAESIASLATALSVFEQGEMAMGLANNTSFLRPITQGTVHAHATRLHRGRTTWVWDVRFSDDEDRTCAVTRMTIAVRAAREGAQPPPLPREAADGRP